MTTYTFENQNDETIEVLPENFNDAIADNFTSVQLNHDHLIDLLAAGYDGNQAAIILEENETAETLPHYITPSIDADDLNEWIDLSASEMAELEASG